MTYYDGRLISDTREIAESETWETQSDWDADADKTGVEVVDGSVQLIDVVVPDSGDLQARYDATALSATDGDPVSTWSDETGNGHDLTAGTAPTYIADGIDGNPVVRFDGVDDFLDVAWTALTHPNHVFLVYRVGANWTGEPIHDGETSTGRHNLSGDNGNWRMFAGASLEGNSHDMNAHVIGGLFDGFNSVMRVDGVQVASGDAGSQDMNGLTVGSNYSQASYAEVDIGEILVYPQDKSGIATDVEFYLSKKWGVPI